MLINKDIQMLDNIIENQELLTQDVELINKYKKVRIYPFRIVSGTQLLTKAGEVDILTNINKEGQYANFYTGNDQITIVWEGSTTLSANNPNQPNQIIETLQVGRYIDLLASEEGLLNKTNNLSTVNLYGIDYTTTETQNTITLFCDTQEDDYETNKVWSFIDRDSENKEFIASSYVPTDYDIQNYVYLILDQRYQSYQWLRIKNVVYSYRNDNRKPISALIEFETINNDFTNTGKSILQYFQPGTPNESYAFPLETYDKDGNAITTLDQKYIQTKTNSFEGVDSIQLDFIGGYALSSVGILGRVVSENNFEKNNDVYQRETQAPQILLLSKSERIVESPFINRLPIQNVFAAYDMYNDVRGVWKSYKEAYGAESVTNSPLSGYNVTATKQVITGMRPKNNDWDNVTNTNTYQGDENSGYYSNTNWFTDGMTNDFWIKPINQSSYVEGVPNFIAGTNNKNISIPQFLNINHILNWGIDELTTNYSQSTKYKLSEVLGIFGNIFSILTGGLDIGWIKNKTLKTGQTYNVLLPTEILENHKAIGNLTSGNALPLDYFNDQLATKMLPVNSNLYTAYRFSLTHLFTYEQSNVNTNRPSYNKLGGGANNVWDTKYLGQAQDEEGYNLLNDGSKFKPDIYKIIPYETREAYLIDWLQTKGIGICDKRVSMYRQKYNEFLETYSEYSVYQLIAQTKSKVKNNITLWSDEIKFNYYDQFNTFGQIQWPKQDLVEGPILDQDKNRQLQVPKEKLWLLQKQWAEGQQGSQISNYSDILTLCYPTLKETTNFNYDEEGGSRGYKQALGKFTDKPSDWVAREKKFQKWFRISNFNTQFLGLEDKHWLQTYKINDIAVNYSENEWAPNETLSNARQNLSSLDLNIAIANPNKVNFGYENFTYKITLTGEELTNFLNGNEVNKDLTIEFNDVPNSLAYPISIFGDFQIPETGYIDKNLGNKCGWYLGNGTWYWLTNLNRLFNESDLTYSLGGTYSKDYFGVYGDIDINLTSEVVNYEDIGNRHRKLAVYKPRYTNLSNYAINLPTSLLNQATGYDNQVKIINPRLGQTTKNSKNKIGDSDYTISLGTKSFFVNNKPKCINPTRKTKITMNFKAKIEGNSGLNIEMSNINVLLDYKGRFESSGNAFGCMSDSSNSKVGDNEWPALNNMNSIMTPRTYKPRSYFEAAGNSKELKIGAAFFRWTNFGDANYIVPRGALDSKGTYYNSCISPNFYFSDVTNSFYNEWLQNTPQKTGDKTGQTNLFKEMWDVVNGGDAWYKTIGDEKGWEMKYPMSAGGMRSGQRMFLVDDDQWSTMSYGLKFQYDPDVNFQPLLAFSFTPKWKN